VKAAEGQKLRVLGVEILDATMDEAVSRLGERLPQSGPAQTVYFVNAHTLNLATADTEFRGVLSRADFVFGDGTGVRWATRILHDLCLRDNVNGTDLVPTLFERYRDRGFSYYLLGATPEAIELAAAEAGRLFPGWTQAGHHDGYLDDARSREVIADINQRRPNLLLVGMGNPLQETWLDRYASELQVPLALGVGGLFTYWSKDITRAPVWVRELGHEWLHLLVSQPHKARRYLIGNPLFLARVTREYLSGMQWPGVPSQGV
jgi:N-acetylglucosaminyldiphosphoundecaprenol N-acetyl-beta-D-mannosaminyltransferase